MLFSIAISVVISYLVYLPAPGGTNELPEVKSELNKEKYEKVVEDLKKNNPIRTKWDLDRLHASIKDKVINGGTFTDLEAVETMRLLRKTEVLIENQEIAEKELREAREEMFADAQGADTSRSVEELVAMSEILLEGTLELLQETTDALERKVAKGVRQITQVSRDKFEPVPVSVGGT